MHLWYRQYAAAAIAAVIVAVVVGIGGHVQLRARQTSFFSFFFFPILYKLTYACGIPAIDDPC